jgi:muramidase (phage lysozyme)
VKFVIVVKFESQINIQYKTTLAGMYRMCERSGDFFPRTTRILQFSSEMQQTLHFYWLRDQNLGKGIKIKSLVYTVPLGPLKIFDF